jgi:hypothetical protein
VFDTFSAPKDPSSESRKRGGWPVSVRLCVRVPSGLDLVSGRLTTGHSSSLTCHWWWVAHCRCFSIDDWEWRKGRRGYLSVWY